MAKVMIVEDEIIIGMMLVAAVQDMGHEAIGTARDARRAYALAMQRPDVALVDVNLVDGQTGPEIGQRLARQFGVSVVFVTANPNSLGTGVPGTLGVLAKPFEELQVRAAVNYALAVRRGECAPPPRALMTFEPVRDAAE
ncbi:MAG: response regulator [Acetobacteraceae bacterium]|nr:response regulator [Acetobacteraceae bacterium]